MNLPKVHFKTKHNPRNIYTLVNLLHELSGSQVPDDWHGMDCVDQHIARGSRSQDTAEAGPGEMGTHTLPLAPWCDVTDIVPMQEAQHRVPSVVCRDEDLLATTKLCPPRTT